MEDPNLETLSVDDIPTNSFLVIKVDVAGPMEKYIAASRMAISLEPYAKIFREKNITIMIMTPKESISILTEEEMNQAGWVRKSG